MSVRHFPAKEQQPSWKGTMGKSVTTPFEHSVALLHEPPPTLQPGYPFTIIVRVRLRGTRISPIQSFALNVSLREAEELHPLNAMSGSLTCSIQGCNSNCVGHLVQFNSLIIHQPGQYRLRILLAASSLAETIVTTRVDSDIIEVGRNTAFSPFQPASLR